MADWSAVAFDSTGWPVAIELRAMALNGVPAGRLRFPFVLGANWLEIGLEATGGIGFGWMGNASSGTLSTLIIGAAVG
jgi:hypothetical protein